MNARTHSFITPPRGISWPAYLWMILLHGLVFATAGPPIGAFFSPGVVIYPYAVIAAYMISFFAALITGLLVGAVAPFVRKAAVLYLLAAVFGAVCAMVFPFGFNPYGLPAGLFVMFGLAGCMAAMICTRLTLGMRREGLPA